MPRVTRYYVGIDLHAEVAQVAIVASNGDVVEERRWELRGCEARRDFVSWLNEWRDARFTVEALGFNRWLVNWMRKLGLAVIVADAGKLALKRTGKKTDRRDAIELARRLRLGDIDQHAATYYPSEREYRLRKLVRVRQRLVNLRTLLGNQILALLRAYGVDRPSGRFYEKTNLEWLAQCPIPSRELQDLIKSLTRLMKDVHREVCLYDQRVKKAAEKTPETLRSIPQIGPLTAVILHCELGELERFRNPRAMASFAGLVPRVTQSADHAHHGRLTRRGSPLLRWAMMQMAIRLMAKNAIVKRWAEPHLKRMHKNKVRTALARRLLIGIAISQREGEPFDLKRCLAMG
jgi:transposase